MCGWREEMEKAKWGDGDKDPNNNNIWNVNEKGVETTIVGKGGSVQGRMEGKG